MTILEDESFSVLSRLIISFRVTRPYSKKGIGLPDHIQRKEQKGAKRMICHRLSKI
jgi:hypothetical protein